MHGMELVTLSQAIFELLDQQAFYQLDKHNQLAFWSQGAERLTGYRHEKVLGQSVLPGCKEAMSRVLQTTNITIAPAEMSVDGAVLQCTQTVRLLQDDNGHYAGALVLFALTSTDDATPAIQNQKPSEKKTSFQGLLSRSPAMHAVFRIIENAAETTATVLVRGESGSGKELVAKAIHKLSARHAAPFLAINCAALSSSLLESELFGHVRGAFTGAIKDHKGLFQRAHGGTLFLDEVAELPLELQAKLLRVIQERNYIPVGGNQTVDVDVRLVAATHRSLREAVKNGLFREDLMFRLRVVPIFIPPLRERREDIPLLLWHFIQIHNAEQVRHIDKIEPQAMKLLLDYAWPGNIRELHNVIEYAFAVGRGGILRLAELPPEFIEPRIRPEAPAHPEVLARVTIPRGQEALLIRQALEQHNGVVNLAAASLGMSRATFWRKRKAYGL